MALEAMREFEAMNILNVSKWHKEHCEDTECNVSMYGLGRTYQSLIGRNLNEDEEKLFT